MLLSLVMVVIGLFLSVNYYLLFFLNEKLIVESAEELTSGVAAHNTISVYHTFEYK